MDLWMRCWSQSELVRWSFGSLVLLYGGALVAWKFNTCWTKEPKNYHTKELPYQFSPTFSQNDHYKPFCLITSAYHQAEALGVRSRVSKSMWIIPKRLS